MAMNGKNAQNIDYSAIFDSFMYASDYAKIKNGTSLEKIVDHLAKTDFDKGKLNQLKEALDNNPELKNAKVISQSHVDGKANGVIHSHGSKATDDNIQAWAFETEDGVYVAYRGTGDGRWPDNGEGFTQKSTDMQEDAQAYFDYVVEKFGLDKSDKNLYVTGHSKGGNEAQYVMMTSKYNDEIDACYSIDGQGFSAEAIKYFQEHNFDGKYDELLKRMYSINGENDYVHPLINPIIPKENTYYVYQIGNDPHDIFSLLTKDGFNWMKDENGNITHGIEGGLCKLSKELFG